MSLSQSLILVDEVNDDISASDFILDCSDVNECLDNNGGCDSKRSCTNTAGGRTCGDCPSGYENDGDTGCTGMC